MLYNYQINQNNDDNSSIPTVLPFIDYDSGTYNYKSEVGSINGTDLQSLLVFE